MHFTWILLALCGACAAEKSLMRRQARIEPDPVAPVKGAPDEPEQQPTLDNGHTAVSIDAQARAQVVQEEGAIGAAPGANAGDLPGFNQDTPGNATDAAATGRADGVSDAEFGAAVKLMDSDCGPLVFQYANALIDLAEYWSNTVQHASVNTSTQEDKRPSRERLQGIMSDWRTELGTHSQVGTCSENIFAMDECMALTECIIQSSECEATLPRQVLATVVELEDEIKTSVWPDFELYFSASAEEVVMGHPCHTSIAEELEAPAGPSFPMVDQVRGAAALMAQVLAPAANSSLLALLKVEDLHGIWRDVCAGLGCDPASWLDIMDSLHGHTAELVSSQAPIRVVGGHIRTMRSSHRAFKHAFGRFSEVLSDFHGQVAEREEAKQRSNTKRYDTAVKEGGRVLNAAARLVGKPKGKRKGKPKPWLKKASKKVKNSIKKMDKFVCIGISVGCVGAWAMKIPFDPPVGNWGVVLAFGLKHSTKASQLKEDFFNLMKLDFDKICLMKVTVFAGALIGFVPGPPTVAGVRAGLFGSVSFPLTFCPRDGFKPKELKIGFVAGLSGAVVTKWGNVALPFDIPPFTAVNGCGVGLTALCCSLTLWPKFKNGCKA